jgi:hypothetical protein
VRPVYTSSSPWAGGARRSPYLNGTGVDQSLITGASDPRGITVDTNHVYWTSVITGAIGRANLDGTGVNESFITGGSESIGIAVDANHIYWTNNAFPHTLLSGAIGRANLDGTGVSQIFIEGSGITDGDRPEPHGGGDALATNLDVGGSPPEPPAPATQVAATAFRSAWA